MLKLKLTKLNFLKIFSVNGYPCLWQKKLKVFLLLCLPILMQLSCNTTEPTDDLKPGRRDYIWTVDTLEGINNPRYRMWGSSPIDIWATSPGEWDKSISHFNGTDWHSFGVSGVIVPNAIFGFDKNIVFFGAENGNIWKYDGNTFFQFAELSKNGHNDIVFANLWGESTDNFYAFGAYHDNDGLPNSSVIAYFNNVWSILDTDSIKGLVSKLYRGKDGKIYLRVINMGNGVYVDSTLIYEYRLEKYHPLYSSIWSRGFEADISRIDNEVIFVLGNQIARRVNNKFQAILNVNNPNFYQRIWGRNTKDIFLLMTDGLAHFDGNDVQYLFNFSKSGTQIFDAVIFENEVFFMLYESQTNLNLIYHGK